MSMVDNNPDHLWDVTNKSTTQRKTVRGQSVSCTCNYSVTNFNSSSAQRLERDFEKSHHYLHDVLLKRVSKQKQSEIAMVNYFKNFMDTINLQDNHNNLVAMLDLLFYWLRETDHKMGLNHKFRSEVIKMIEIGILVLKKYGVYQDHFYIFGQLINTRGSSEWGLNLISLPTEWDAGSILYVKQLLECIINPISSALKDKSYYLNEKDFLKYLDYLPMNQVLQTLLLNWPRLIFDHEKTCNLIYTFAQIYTYGLIKITGRSSISKLLGSKLKLVILTFCHYLQKKHYSLRNNTNNQIIYPDPFAYYRNNNFYENDIDFSLFKKHFSSFSTLDQIFLDNMLINLIVLINKSKDRSLIKYFEPFPFHTCSIKTCWKLLGILIGRYDATQGLEPSYENWKLLITEMPQIHQNYSDFLNNKHSTHLFKILLKISFAQPFWLISIIAEEIYWGSFINQNNKNIDKNINDPLKILNEMCLSNPRLISMLFRQTIKNFDKINVNYQLIWSNLPLSLWNLNIIDFNYFKQFFKYNINEKRFQFIYFLLTKLNYEFKSINKNRLNTFRKNQLLKFQNYQNFKKVTIDLKEAENENENDNKNKKKKPKKKKKKKKKTDPYNKVKSVKLHKWSNIKIPTEFSEFQFQRKLENSNNDNNNINNENNDEKEVTNNENDNENKKKENNKIDEEIIELENKENTNKFNGNFQINLNFDEFDNNNTTTNNNNTINNNNNTTTNNNITTTNNNNNTNDINTTTTTDINTTTTNTTNNNDTNIINENNNKEINIINENNDINIINENNTNENKEIEIEKSQENQNINDEIKTLEETLKPEELNLPIFLLPNIHIKLAILIMKFYFKSIYNNNDLKKNQKKEYTNFCWKYIQKIKVYNKFGMPFEDLINYPNDERFSFEKYIKSFLSIEDPFIAYCLLKFTNIWNYDAINFLFDILIKNKQFYYLSEILLYRIPLLINDNLNISLQEGNEKETEENQEEKKKKEKEKEINYNIFYKLTNKIFNPIDNLINNNNNLPETNLIDLNNKKIKIKTKINFFSIISQIQMTQRIFFKTI
ncbi:stress response protein nst1 [Anaeramoeba flamelloides]|uniref:Stress response protein nst1 n=1 Tax=Anaeramoeba flamelloides TaxID=1746091 RepID=A0AAV7YMS8_9EUKA|nr:stress response protein nst1 [Anaeramoeba flamelloides]